MVRDSDKPTEDAEQYQTNLPELLDRFHTTVEQAVEAADDGDFSTVREKLAEVNKNINTLRMQANIEEQNAEGDSDG